MRYTGMIPSNLDGETALLLVDILQLIAEEIYSRNDEAIRAFFYRPDDIEISNSGDQGQLSLPLMDPFFDFPF